VESNFVVVDDFNVDVGMEGFGDFVEELLFPFGTAVRDLLMPD
jgi:hypothetical protein